MSQSGEMSRLLSNRIMGLSDVFANSIMIEKKLTISPLANHILNFGDSHAAGDPKIIISQVLGSKATDYLARKRGLIKIYKSYKS